jgi:hypothetical protein
MQPARVEHALIALSERLPHDLARILCQNSEKTYPLPSWLVIRNAHPLWTRKEFETHVVDWSPPTHVPFEQIWLVCETNGSSGLLQLYTKGAA